MNKSGFLKGISPYEKMVAGNICSRTRISISQTITLSFARLLLINFLILIAKTKKPDRTEQTIRPGRNNNRVQEAEKHFVSRTFVRLWGADCIQIRVICQKSSCSFEQGLFSYICFLHMRQAKVSPASSMGAGFAL